MVLCNTGKIKGLTWIFVGQEVDVPNGTTDIKGSSK